MPDGETIRGIWYDAELVQEVVQKDVNYENNTALNNF